MLYRIAICDDDIEFRQVLHHRITAILKEKGIDFSIIQCSTGEELLRELEQGMQPMNMIFLDILMGELNGIDTARNIRQKDSQASIVFITSTDQYVFSGYEVQALQYLMKPIQEQQLSQILQFDLRRRFNKQYFTFRIKLTTYHIAHEEILFLESDLKATKLSSKSGTYRLPMRISELETYLPKATFCRCHRGFIVNLGYITDINSKMLTLDQTTQIPIGKIYAEATKHAFLSYIGAQTM